MIDWTIVLVAAISAVGGPGLLIIITSRQRSREKKEDNARADAIEERREARQNEVAAQTEKAAELLVESNEKVAAVAAETKASVERSSEEQKAEIKAVHKLVNSGMLRQMQLTLDQMETNLALRKEDWNGHTPSAQERSLVDAQEKLIAAQKKAMEELKTASEFTAQGMDFLRSRTEEEP